MIEITDQTLSTIVQSVVQEVNPESIFLFGSRAKGYAHPDSDLDLMVVVRGPFVPGRMRRDEIARIRHALSGYLIAKDILVYTADEVARWRNSASHIIARAIREGKELYARP